MSNLSERRCRVVVALPYSGPPIVGPFIDYSTFSAQVLEIDNLRVQFRISRKLVRHANTGEITITNLSENSRATLQIAGGKVALYAGYKDNLAQIFTGDIRETESMIKGPDWETRIQAGDGERALQHARVSASFGPGTKKKDVAHSMVEYMGLSPGNLDEELDDLDEEYTAGYSAHGKAAKELSTVLASLGYDYTVRDGAVVVYSIRGFHGEQVIELSPDSGLIGSPEHGTTAGGDGKSKKTKKATLKVKSLIQPQLVPGRRVKVSGVRSGNGVYRITSVDHSGDTAGGNWYTDLELEVST